MQGGNYGIHAALGLPGAGAAGMGDWLAVRFGADAAASALLAPQPLTALAGGHPCASPYAHALVCDPRLVPLAAQLADGWAAAGAGMGFLPSAPPAPLQCVGPAALCPTAPGAAAGSDAWAGVWQVLEAHAAAVAADVGLGPAHAPPWAEPWTGAATAAGRNAAGETAGGAAAAAAAAEYARAQLWRQTGDGMSLGIAQLGGWGASLPGDAASAAGAAATAASIQPAPAGAAAEGGDAGGAEDKDARRRRLAHEAQLRFRERKRNLLSSLEADLAEKLTLAGQLSAANEALRVRERVLQRCVASGETIVGRLQQEQAAGEAHGGGGGGAEQQACPDAPGATAGRGGSADDKVASPEGGGDGWVDLLERVMGIVQRMPPSMELSKEALAALVLAYRTYMDQARAAVALQGSPEGEAAMAAAIKRLTHWGDWFGRLYVHCPLARRQLAMLNLETGVREDPPPGHWERVLTRVRRLKGAVAAGERPSAGAGADAAGARGSDAAAASGTAGAQAPAAAAPLSAGKPGMSTEAMVELRELHRLYTASAAEVLAEQAGIKAELDALRSKSPLEGETYEGVAVKYANLLLSLEDSLRREHSLLHIHYWGSMKILPKDIIVMMFTESYPYLPDWPSIATIGMRTARAYGHNMPP